MEKFVYGFFVGCVMWYILLQVSNHLNEKYYELMIDIPIPVRIRDKFAYFVSEKKYCKEPCEYCRGTEAEYQYTHTTKLSINTFGKARTIITENNPCPPYAKCAMKDIPDRSAFPINFCPHCGRDLRT